MAFFINDIKEQVGNLQVTDSWPLHFQRYEVHDIEGKSYLVGFNHMGERSSKSYGSPALLLALVGLVVPPLPAALLSKDPGPMDRAIPTKRIMAFCKRFGLPYQDGAPAPMSAAIDDLLMPDRSLPAAAVELQHLRYLVGQLYMHFRAWDALRNGDTEYLSLFLNGWGTSNGDKRKAAKERLAMETSSALSKVQVYSNFDNRADKFTLAIRSRSLIDVAYYHLACLLTMPDSEAAKHLRKCENPHCGGLFWATHGHAKYCAYCDRRTVHKKKGRVKNGLA